MMEDAAAVLTLGTSAGLLVASLGAWKDTPFEAFSRRAFLRSVALGAIFGLVAWWVHPHAARVLIFLSAIAYERLATETYKLFLRPAPAGRKIPSQFAVMGRPVMRVPLRLAAGAAFIALVALVLLVTAQIPLENEKWQWTAVGLWAGLLVALGGAWKDAPIEGWSTSAFLRSPIIGAAVGALLMGYTDDAVSLLLACIGAERLVLEIYKVAIRRARPSKFFGPERKSAEARDVAAWRVTYRTALAIIMIGVFVSW